MEMNAEKNNSSQAVNFTELTSQDLTWDDIECTIGCELDQLATTVTDVDLDCSPTEQHQFNPDDLSLFSDFANNLPSPAAQASSDMEVKAINSSLVVRVEGVADTGTNLTQDADLHELDLDCPDEISLSSQMEDIIADILDTSVSVLCCEKQASEGENEEVHNEPEERDMLQSDDNGSRSDIHVNQSELPCTVQSSYAENNEWHGMNETADDVAESSCPVNKENSNRLQVAEVAIDSSSVTERSKADDESEIERGEKLDDEQCDNGCHNSDNDDDDSDGDMTASQEWLYDQLHTHLVQQHDEASRLNSLRVRLSAPPPGTSSVPRTAISRAIHAFTTELEVVKLDAELTNNLLVDNPKISKCCQLLDDYNLYELSPGVLVQYPFFAGTVDACCRWEGHLADELHTAAHRLRAFMMAMYARHSVDEGFLTALDRQVQYYY